MRYKILDAQKTGNFNFRIPYAEFFPPAVVQKEEDFLEH